MPEKTVTLKDTKSTIMSAYEGALATIKAMKAQQFNPVEIKNKEANEEAITHVESMGVDWDLGTLFTQMRKGIDHHMRDMQVSLESEKEELDKVRRAKAALTEELQDLYGIAAEAQALAALVEAQKIKEEEFRALERERKLELESELAEHREGMTQERAVWDEERDKRAQEWDYSFQRTCKQRTDALEDELSSTKKKWLAEVEDKEKKLTEREESVAKQEDEIEELKAEVASFPAQLEEAEATARKKASQSYDIEVSALKRNHEADVKVIKHEADTLRGTKEGLESKVFDLEAKLEAAYDKIQGVASKALDAQGNALTTSEVQKAVAAATHSKK